MARMGRMGRKVEVQDVLGKLVHAPSVTRLKQFSLVSLIFCYVQISQPWLKMIAFPIYNIPKWHAPAYFHVSFTQDHQACIPFQQMRSHILEPYQSLWHTLPVKQDSNIISRVAGWKHGAPMSCEPPYLKIWKTHLPQHSAFMLAALWMTFSNLGSYTSGKSEAAG